MRLFHRRRALTATFLAGLLVVTAACGDDDEETTEAGTETTAAPGTTGGTATSAAPDAPDAGGLDELVAAATEEGRVNLIALPDSWANYKGILAAFGEKYPGIEYPVANPDASSADELTAVRTLAGQPDMPDALDVGPSFALQAKDEGLWEPYQPSTWDEIPDSLKDPDGHWIAAYYGIMAIATNTTIVDEVPRTFADLLDDRYEGQVALNGDPRESGAAFAAVMAASLANGGSFDDIMPGIEYFAELKAAGNLIPVQVTEATVLSGETPIVLDWTYNFPGLRPALEEAGITMEVVVPSDGVYGSFYAQGVVKGSPHQNGAKLWIEHILSDEGALGYLEGGAIPARYASLVERGLVTPEISANLPAAELIEQITFPSAEQIAAANEVLTENWGPMVADA